MRSLCRNSLLLLLGAGLMGLSLASCDDLIEPDISARHVLLLTPTDSSRTAVVVQTFRWEPVANARSYRIQVASPSFASPTKAFHDSTVTRTFFTTTLVPGAYQWRVQAVNGSYETAFSTRGFQLDTTTRLTGQTLQLGLPAAGAVTNVPVVNFSWTGLPMAQRYQLVISPNPRAGGGAALDTLVGTATAVSLRLPRTSQVYQWHITALNANSSATSATRTVEVDVTPPAAPTLVSPAASALFLTLPVTLTWSHPSTDVVRDSVFFYEPNQTALFSGFPKASSGTTLVLPAPAIPLSTGTYYWSVRSVDRAGNVGPAAAKRPFIIQ
ncbi:hypothetical protein [Hymenobacter segetis]